MKKRRDRGREGVSKREKERRKKEKERERERKREREREVRASLFSSTQQRVFVQSCIAHQGLH